MMKSLQNLRMDEDNKRITTLGNTEDEQWIS